MRQSQLFTKTRRENPADEESVNARLLIRGGFIRKEMAGVYTFLPLGWRVLKRIEQIVRDEMTAAGGQEILMPALQPKTNWEQTERWEGFDALFKLQSPTSQAEYALGPTHEEIVVPLMRQYVSSYKDLPCAVFQIQTKFRDEKRAKSGILRGREFLMKDLYSFHADDEKDLDAYYEKMRGVYETVFRKAGIGEQTYFTFASGGTFSQYSHEFQAIAASGEDTIHVCNACNIAVNEEIIEGTPSCLVCGAQELAKHSAIEVGNIFKLKTKFSKPFDLSYKDNDGKSHTVLMGCYGIGITRLMGTIVELFHDKAGILWPESVAPFQIHLLALPGGESEAETWYANLEAAGYEVLYDDRGVSAGEKLFDSDLLGIPMRLIVSGRTMNTGTFEVKNRQEEEGREIPFKEIFGVLPPPRTPVRAE